MKCLGKSTKDKRSEIAHVQHIEGICVLKIAKGEQKDPREVMRKYIMDCGVASSMALNKVDWRSSFHRADNGWIMDGMIN